MKAPALNRGRIRELYSQIFANFQRNLLKIGMNFRLTLENLALPGQ